MERNSQSPVFVAVIDDEADLAYLFKEALSQIDGVQVFAFTDPSLALEHFKALDWYSLDVKKLKVTYRIYCKEYVKKFVIT